MSPPEPVEIRWIAVGRLTRAHGVRGETVVLPLSQVSSRFEPGSRVFAGESDERPLRVDQVRPFNRGRLLVRFAEIPDRTVAETLAGEYLFVPASEVPALPEGEYWPHQLIGCQVVTESGRSLGPIKEVVHTPANDVWTTDGLDGEGLVPALKDIVVSVDIEGRRVVVRDVPGLTAPEV